MLLRASFTFFILAFVAIIFGVTGVAGFTLETGKILLIVFLTLSIISFLAGTWTGKGPRTHS